MITNNYKITKIINDNNIEQEITIKEFSKEQYTNEEILKDIKNLYNERKIIREIEKIYHSIINQEQYKINKIDTSEQEIKINFYNNDELIKNKIIHYNINLKDKYFKGIYRAKDSKEIIFLCNAQNSTFANYYFKTKEKPPFYLIDVIEITKEQYQELSQEKLKNKS